MANANVLDPAAVLVGRTAELARITQAIDARGALLITGERGAGRSRLLTAGTELARHDARRRIVVVHTASAVLPLLRQLLLAIRHDRPDLLRLLPFVEPATLLGEIPEAFADINRRTPTVVVADDVERAPDPVTTMLSTMPGTVLLAADSDRIPESLTGLPALRLTPLGPQASVRLLDAREHPPTGRERVEILRRAAGNPAALAEIGRGGPVQAGFAADLAELPESSRRLLLHLAAASSPADPRMVAEAAAVSGEGQWHAAEQARLVTLLGGVVRFAHPLAADAAYWSATAHQRREAHRNLAATLTAAPEWAALHRAAAVSEPDEVLAADLEAAADAFRSRGELFEATVAVQRAAERSPRPRDAARLFARAVGDACDLGATEWAIELHAAVRERTDDPGPIAQAAAAAARALSRTGHQHEAYELIAAARGTGSPALVGPATAVTVISGSQEHRHGLAVALAEAGPGLDPLLATFARLVVDPAAHPGRELCEATTPPPAGASLSARERSRVAVTGSIALFEDHTRLAVDLLRAAVTGSSPSVAETVPLLAGALIDTGQWEFAERHLARPVLDGMPVAAAHRDALRAHLLVLRGDSATALELIRKVWARLDVEQHRAIHVRLLRGAGLAALVNGEYDEAYRHLRAMFDRDGRPLQILAGRGIADLGAAAARSDHHEDVRPILAGVRAEAGAEPSTRMRLLLHVTDGLLGDGDRAEHHYRLATVDPAGQEWPYERAMARLHYGEYLRRARRPRDARAVLSAAAEVFGRLGARPASVLAAGELAASGQTGELVTGTQLSLLTPQERQVARLAARGLRNREIAERLFLSPRTVGAHLYSIYPKLGITGRHQLADAFPPG